MNFSWWTHPFPHNPSVIDCVLLLSPQHTPHHLDGFQCSPTDLQTNFLPYSPSELKDYYCVRDVLQQKYKFWSPWWGSQLDELALTLIRPWYVLNPSSPIRSFLVTISQYFLSPLEKRNSSTSCIFQKTDQGLVSFSKSPYSFVPLKLFSVSHSN